jgi:hypothetical protein
MNCTITFQEEEDVASETLRKRLSGGPKLNTSAHALNTHHGRCKPDKVIQIEGRAVSYWIVPQEGSYRNY